MLVESGRAMQAAWAAVQYRCGSTLRRRSILTLVAGTPRTYNRTMATRCDSLRFGYPRLLTGVAVVLGRARECEHVACADTVFLRAAAELLLPA